MMSEAAAIIKDWWAVIVGLVSAIALVARIEQRSSQNARELSRETKARETSIAALEIRLEKQRQEDMALRRQDREETQSILKELRDDIKQLLQMVSK